MADAAAKIMMGASLKDLKLKHNKFSHFGVKESVFPFNTYPEVDPVLGLVDSFPTAYFKAQKAAKPSLPTEGTVLIRTQKKSPLVQEIAKEFDKLGFKILSTEGTPKFISKSNIRAELILKLNEGRPNINDAIANK